MTEKEFQQQVEDLCKWLGLRYYHTHDSRRSNPGYPDLTIVGRRLVFAELKTEKGRVTAKQQEWIDALRAADQEVYVWRPSQIRQITGALKALR